MSKTTGFGFTEETSEVTGKFIQITPETAIAEGRFIESLEFLEDDDHPRFKVVIRNAAGQTAQKAWFEPKMDKYTTDEKALNAKIGRFNAVMANLSRRFLGDSYSPQGVTDFKSLCKTVIKDIGNKYVDKELRIKVVYDKSGFPTLPQNAPIFEDIDVEVSKLTINPKYDNVVSTYTAPDTDTDIPLATSDSF